MKTGMLPSAGVVKGLCESLRKFPVKGMDNCFKSSVRTYCSLIYLLRPMLMKATLVVDPVLVSTSGDTLSGPSTLAKYRYGINLHFVCMHLRVLDGFAIPVTSSIT